MAGDAARVPQHSGDFLSVGQVRVAHQVITHGFPDGGQRIVMKRSSFIFRVVVGGFIGAVLLPVAAQPLRVDFNGVSAQTAAGFQAYTAQHEVTASFGSRIYAAFGTNITVTPTWTGTPATNTAQQAIVRGSFNGYSTNAADLPELMIDWIGTDQRENPGDPMTLTLSGLPAGSYGWLSYHHDTQDQQGRFSVTVNDATGSATTSGLQISSTQAQAKTNLAQVTKFTTTITSDGINPISLVWEATDAPTFNTMFVMNGFELTNSVVVAPQQTNAALRRPVSPQQPMWLVHIDTWNYADPQKIIDLIPPDIRPFVVMNLSMSISHTVSNSQFRVAEYGYETVKSWLRVCAQNRMWAMIQQSSGGFQHFSDFDLTVYEEFFREYPNLIGFNYAEQFWGYDDPNDPLSPAWSDRITHFANLLGLCNKYGGYLVVSWCGNQWSPNINPIGMLKRNPAFAAASRAFTKNYILCEKYTQQSYQSDMESLCLGAYLSGYSGQYGIRYDETGWTDATGTNQNFILATGFAAHLEHIMLTGQTVIDGPELIWRECFRELSAGSTSNSYTMRRWDTYPQFGNVSVDIFRKVLDGTIRIPSRQEVIDRTKVVIINNVNTGSADTIYSSPETLFEGLYRMDGDGNLRDNKTFYKKTGRYPTIPTVYQLDDAVANSFQVKVNRSAYGTRWPSLATKTNEFNTLFPQEYTGDLYAGRHENGWVIYNPYKTGQVATNSIPFQYNTCDRVELSFGQYTAAVMKESATNLTFYLANYDNEINTGLMTNTIRIYGSTVEPTYSHTDRGNHQVSVLSKTWLGGVFTLTVRHNGPLDINVNCAGTATGRLTAFTPAVVIPPAQPLVYTGPLQFEAEVFDYRNIAGVVASGWDQPVRNYRGQGYLRFGTSSLAAVRDSVTVRKAGLYRLEIRYSVEGGSRGGIDLYVNGVRISELVFAQTPSFSNWAIHSRLISLNAGANTIELRSTATGARTIYFDGIVVVPTAYGDGLVIQENQSGFDRVDGTIENNHPGYTGSGFVQPVATNGASIYWNAYFDAAPVKSFTFRYASTNARTANLIINGVDVASKVFFPSTGSFATWDYATVNAYVAPGAAEVKLQANSAAGLPHIDSIELIGGGPENAAPTLGAIGDRTIGVGMTLSITNSALDGDIPAQTLTYSLLVAPTNATLNASNGVLTWRPMVSQADSSNPFSVAVADNGTPSLSATQSFLVTVTNLVSPQMGATFSGGALVLQVNGASGPDYQIQSSTNLTDWSVRFTTNSPAMPFLWANPSSELPMDFFRVRVGPPF
jgi:hypothetical protein